MRGDLADMRLAGLVFAPHYAAPLPMTIVRPAQLRVSAGAAADKLAELGSGDVFEALDFAGGWAWGIAVRAGLVGYVERDALAVLTADI